MKRPVENEDYYLVPVGDDEWNVRFLTEFPEVVIKYRAISFDERNECINFSFDLVDEVDEELTPDNPELQEWAGKVLHSILEGAVETGDDLS